MHLDERIACASHEPCEDACAPTARNQSAGETRLRLAHERQPSRSSASQHRQPTVQGCGALCHTSHMVRQIQTITKSSRWTASSPMACQPWSRNSSLHGVRSTVRSSLSSKPQQTKGKYIGEGGAPDFFTAQSKFRRARRVLRPVLRPSSSSTTMPLPQRPRWVSAEALDVMPAAEHAAEPRSSLAATSADHFFNTCVDVVLVL